MHFRPLHDRVLVRRIDAEEKTAAGIIGQDYLIMKESDLLGVVEKAGNQKKAA